MMLLLILGTLFFKIEMTKHFRIEVKFDQQIYQTGRLVRFYTAVAHFIGMFLGNLYFFWKHVLTKGPDDSFPPVPPNHSSLFKMMRKVLCVLLAALVCGAMAQLTAKKMHQLNRLMDYAISDSDEIVYAYSHWVRLENLSVHTMRTSSRCQPALRADKRAFVFVALFSVFRSSPQLRPPHQPF